MFDGKNNHMCIGILFVIILFFSVITGTVYAQTYDYGDAPDPYPTKNNWGGAFHPIDQKVCLGALIDADTDGQPTSGADGDDTDGNDDEDGFQFATTMTAGSTVSLYVTASVEGKLNGWVDFNRDGDWADSGEQVFNDKNLTAGTSTVSFTVPGDVSIGTSYIRFRFSQAGGESYGNYSSNTGEVEDYKIRFEAAASSSIGDLIWEDTDENGNADAGEPGIDGVTVDLVRDSNGDGVLDAGEPILDTQTTSGGGYYAFSYLEAGDYLVDVTDTGGVLAGYVQTGGTDPHPVTGLAEEIHYEGADFGYALAGYDYGDAPDSYQTTNQNGGARHLTYPGFYLGYSVDGDEDGQPGEDARGDDEDGNDDDDGVRFKGVFSPGDTVYAAVVTSAAGVLQFWIDYNGDGDWNDQEEDLGIHQTVPGTTTLLIIVPENAEEGITYARFRYAESALPGPGGAASIGEVEDYVIEIFDRLEVVYEYGDAPEGVTAYPHLDVEGRFPTCVEIGPAGYVRHGTRGEMMLGYETDYETDGNAGFCFPSGDDYDADEGMNDIRTSVRIYEDIGLIKPFVYTIQEVEGNLYYRPYSAYGLSRGALGEAGETVEWGSQIDLHYHVTAPEGAYANMLVDWNQDGEWGGPAEHVLVNFFVPAGFDDLSELDPPDFVIEDTPGFAWVRFTLSDTPVDEGWDGAGEFADGETEDYLICVTYDGLYDYGDAPDGTLAYPSTGVTGQFPTCEGREETGYIRHGHGGTRYFGIVDYEYGGNAGLCPLFTMYYNADESFLDDRKLYYTNDAGLYDLFPHTISGMSGLEFVNDYDDGTGLPNTLGSVGQIAEWGVNLDLSTVILSGQTGAYVNVLFDWNQDGDWKDIVEMPDHRTTTPERVLRNFYISGHGSRRLSDLAPPSFQIGPNSGYVWMRCTITKTPVDAWGWDGSGDYVDGETEDYLIKIDDYSMTFEFGDVPILAYGVLHVDNGAIHTVQSGFCLGELVDPDPDGQPFPGGNGDDFDGMNDDDGIAFLTPLIPGQEAQVKATVSGTGFLNGWIDFNADSSWDDPGELIWNDFQVTSGDYVRTITVPAEAMLGVTYARFRFCDTPGMSSDGPAHFSEYPEQGDLPPVGEVEDYAVLIQEENADFDFGDAPDPVYPTLLASSGAYHVHDPDVYMGNQIDTEADGIPDALCEGDDNNGGDDEDGVFFPSLLVPGTTGAGTVILSVEGYLNVWIDLDGDGSWSGMYEHIVRDTVLIAGSHTIWLPVPEVTVTDALLIARVRFSTYPGAGFSGPAADGEVEDYRVNLEITGADDNGSVIPEKFSLKQNYPNPFNPVTTIRYTLPAEADVMLTVYDVTGSVVRKISAGIQSAGNHSLEWNGRNEHGSRAASGLYFYRLEARSGKRATTTTDVKKMILLK